MGHILSTPIENKWLERVGNHYLRAGSSEIQGYRVSMEDTHILCTSLNPHKAGQDDISLFAVFDGHSGNAASDFMKERLTAALASLPDPMNPDAITKMILQLDEEFMSDEDRRTHGCTAVFALIQPIRSNTLGNSNSNDKSATTSSNQSSPSQSSITPANDDSSAATLAPTSPPSSPTNNTDKENSTNAANGNNNAAVPPSSSSSSAASTTMSNNTTSTTTTSSDSKPRHGSRKSISTSPRQRYKILVGNIGDSRAVLIEKDGSVSGVTSDHKPDNADEQQRISSAGGRVQFGRVDGELAMSRAIGDYNYKLDGSLTPTRQKVIAVPEYLELTADTDDVLLLCCDGLFEKLSTEQVATFIHLCMRKPNSQAQDPAVICSKLIDYSLAKGSKDNMSALLIQFRDGRSYGKEAELLAGPIPENVTEDKKFIETYVNDARRHQPDITFDQLQLMSQSSQQYRDQQLKQLDELDDEMIAQSKQRRGSHFRKFQESDDQDYDYT